MSLRSVPPLKKRCSFDHLPKQPVDGDVTGSSQFYTEGQAAECYRSFPHVSASTKSKRFKPLRALYKELKRKGPLRFQKALLKQLFPEQAFSPDINEGDSREGTAEVLVLPLEEDLNKKDFYSTVEALLERLHYFADHIGSSQPSYTSELLEVLERLEEKKILISAFGRYNAGKSTLLNALLAVRILPTKGEAATSVKVLIRDDEAVHRGPCSTPVLGEGRRKIPCPKCPHLEGGESTTRGVKDVRAELERANQEARELVQEGQKQSEEGAHNEEKEYTLAVNVPAIRGVVNPWKVYLVDNPGSGDANTLVNNLADVTVKSSQAYVYLVHYRYLGDQEDFRCYGEIYKRDPDVFRQQRLVVVVTHFDVYYTALGDHDKVAPDEIRKNVCQTIKQATGEEFSGEMVIPVCSEWANTARQLKHSTESRRLRGIATRYLEDYTSESQDQEEEVDIDGLESWDIARKLEDASGVLDLEEKIQRMASSCAKIWRRSLERDCARFVKESTDRLTARIKSLSESQQGMSRLLSDDLEVRFQVVSDQLQAMHETIQESSSVYKALDQNYPEDVAVRAIKPAQFLGVEASKKVVENGQERAMQLYVTFSAEVTSRSQQYTIQEFDKAVMKFLTDLSADLEEKFECAHFYKMQEQYENHLMKMSSHYTFLVSSAEKLCGMRRTLSVSSTDEEHDFAATPKKKMVEVFKEHPPDLKHLKDQIKPFEPLLSRWNKFWRKLCTMFRKEKMSNELVVNLIDPLKGMLESECEKYFKDLRPEIVQYFFDKYCRATKVNLKAFKEKFEDSGKIAEEKVKMEKVREEIAGCQQEIQLYQSWCDHLHAVERLVHEQA